MSYTMHFSYCYYYLFNFISSIPFSFTTKLFKLIIANVIITEAIVVIVIAISN